MAVSVVGPGAGVPRKKGKSGPGNRSVGYKSRNEPETRELLEADTTKQESRGQREPTNGLESRRGTAIIGYKRGY